MNSTFAASLPALGPTGSRQRILRVAARLFRERGYHATTIRAISEIVGMLSGSLFHHFRSKQQILLEVMHEAAAQLCDKAESALAAARSPRERLRALIKVQLQCLTGPETHDFYAVMIGEWREVDESDRQELTELRLRYKSLWQMVTTECADAGILRADPRLTRLLLHGAINWASVWFRPEGAQSVDDLVGSLEGLVTERA